MTKIAKDSSSEGSGDKSSIAPSESSEVFLSPSDCLRGLSNADLMQIADNGEVFRQFVRSISGGDQHASPSPTSTPGANTGAIPKREWPSHSGPYTSRLPIPRRNSSSQVRVITHEGEGERNLRSYLQGSSRAGQDGRRNFRRRLIREEDERQRQLDLKREQTEQAEKKLAEENEITRLVPTPEPEGKEKLDCGGISVKFDKSGDAVETLKIGKSSKRNKNRRGRRRISSILRAIFRRRSNSRWYRGKTRLKRFFSSVKNSLVRATRFLLCCYYYRS